MKAMSEDYTLEDLVTQGYINDQDLMKIKKINIKLLSEQEKINQFIQLIVRLSKIVKPYAISPWLNYQGIVVLKGQTPFDLIEKGEFKELNRLLSGLEETIAS